MTGELDKIAIDTWDKAEPALRGAKISFAKGNQTIKKKLVAELEKTLDLIEKAINQAKTVVSGHRRIEDRLVGIHDPEARPIRKGKRGKPVQFGRKPLLTGNEQGFITGHKLYQGNPNAKTSFKTEFKDTSAMLGKKPKKRRRIAVFTLRGMRRLPKPKGYGLPC